MNRKFGIELEIVSINRQTALRALRAVGINVQDESYNHSTRNHWKLVSDASVPNGFEVVSPVLHGEAGIEEAMTVAAALDDAGATVNRSCGFHVHFDAADLTVNDVKTIVKRYAAHEAEIDAIMPPSRRNSTNTFCKSLSGIPFERFMRSFNIIEMGAVMGSRYYKVNLMSFQRHGTIEFRQHSGTINARKIANWVRFLGQFIDACKLQNNAPAAPAPVIEHPSLRGVQARLAEMFTSQGVVTLTAMCDTFGWLPHTARAAVTRLRRMGMRIESVRGQSAYRLVGGMMSQAAPTPRLESLWAGISESVVRFYRNRAAVLAATV